MWKRILFASIVLPTAVGAFTQARAIIAPAVSEQTDQDARAIRALLAYGYEESWNSHRPALAVTPDKCVDDAVFINITGGWIKGPRAWADMLTPLHAPGGRMHEQTRRHVVEDLRFIRPDVVIAVVKTFDHRVAGVPTPESETRGLVVLSKEGGQWKLTANQNGRIQTTVDGNR